MTIGDRIKNKRIELGLSQDELAKKCGYKSRSSINKIELSRKLPADKIQLVARALDTTEAYIMGWQDADPQIQAQNDFEIITLYNKLSDENKLLVKSMMENLAK